MANTLYLAPTQNFVTKTINGAINDSTNTITLNSTTNMQSPGYIIINRENTAGEATPSSREFVSYTGISGSDLTGCTRGADGSTARSHADSSTVETVMTVGMFNSLATIVDRAVDTEGMLKATTSLTSVSGIGLNPVWILNGNYSGPTTLTQTPLVMPSTGAWRSFNVVTRTVVSTASLVIDINKNGTSIFDAGTRPAIAAGGTLVSTASVKTKGFSPGDRISVDIDIVADEDTHVTDISVFGDA